MSDSHQKEETHTNTSTTKKVVVTPTVLPSQHLQRSYVPYISNYTQYRPVSPVNHLALA